VNEGTTPSWCEPLYHAKARELILYGRVLGLSHAEAEDVLQETFVALCQRAAPPDNPGHYCVRSFRNRALNYRRSFWRRVAREFESHRWFERDADETEAEGEAMRRLAGLPAAQREVIVLKLWHDCTFEEIGGLIEVSPDTAASRYRYGLEKLRAGLTGKSYERDKCVGGPVAFLDSAPPLAEG
jgi:RNA polymerase sigma-70 factor (ECF subfamily)